MVGTLAPVSPGAAIFSRGYLTQWECSRKMAMLALFNVLAVIPFPVLLIVVYLHKPEPYVLIIMVIAAIVVCCIGVIIPFPWCIEAACLEARGEPLVDPAELTPSAVFSITDEDDPEDVEEAPQSKTTTAEHDL